MSTAEKLSPRQRECLRLVYERQATSKEIAQQLGIAHTTVSAHIRDAVELLGARDRREAAWMAFGAEPRTGVGAISLGVADAARSPTNQEGLTDNPPATRSWPDPRRSRNTLSPGQTFAAIAAAAFASVAGLALIVGMARGMGGIVYPVLTAFDRLTH